MKRASVRQALRDRAVPALAVPDAARVEGTECQTRRKTRCEPIFSDSYSKADSAASVAASVKARFYKFRIVSIKLILPLPLRLGY